MSYESLNQARTAVEEIYTAYQNSWSYDSRDLERVDDHKILDELINQKSDNLKERLREELFVNGPLTPLLPDVLISEIIINGANEIWIEKQGSLLPHNDHFLSPWTFERFIDRLCSEAKIKVDLSEPFANGRYQDFRVHMARAPLSHCTYHVNLRRIKQEGWTLAQLAEKNWAPAQAIELLQTLITKKKNLLFIGPTGCGKTSVLGACLAELNSYERVVIIEDTDELLRPNAVSTKLLSRPQLSLNLPEVTLSQLLKQSLRMRPDRLVMGEVRGEEAKDLLMTLSTGHAGSFGTLHASDARQALLRLEMLVQLGAPQWDLRAIRQLLQLSLDAIVVCEIENGHRQLRGIYGLAALESFGILLEPLFTAQT